MNYDLKRKLETIAGILIEETVKNCLPDISGNDFVEKKLKSLQNANKKIEEYLNEKPWSFSDKLNDPEFKRGFNLALALDCTLKDFVDLLSNEK